MGTPYCLVSDSVSVFVAELTKPGIHEAVHVSVIVEETDVAVGVAVPTPVIEQVLDPRAVKAPAGTVSVSESCVPEIVPDRVELAETVEPAGVMTNGPVTVVPLCVAVHVTGLGAPIPAVSVPDQAPARLSPVDGDVVELLLLLEHAAPIAQMAVTKPMRRRPDRTMCLSLCGPSRKLGVNEFRRACRG
jgi:hypothetical protein